MPNWKFHLPTIHFQGAFAVSSPDWCVARGPILPEVTPRMGYGRISMQSLIIEKKKATTEALVKRPKGNYSLHILFKSFT